MITKRYYSRSGLSVLVLSAALVALFARLAQLRSRYKVITDTETETRRLRAEATRDNRATQDQRRPRARNPKEPRSKTSGSNGSLAATTPRRRQLRTAPPTGLALRREPRGHLLWSLQAPISNTTHPITIRRPRTGRRQAKGHAPRRPRQFASPWSGPVGGSRREGERMQRQYTKLLLRAFNASARQAIAKWRGTMPARWRSGSERRLRPIKRNLVALCRSPSCNRTWS